MFAVPGWNLSSTVKTQVAAPESTSSSKKRKRSDEIGSKEEKRSKDLVDLAKLGANGQLVRKKKNKVTGSNAVEIGERGAAPKKAGRNQRRKKARDERLRNVNIGGEGKADISEARSEEQLLKRSTDLEHRKDKKATAEKTSKQPPGDDVGKTNEDERPPKKHKKDKKIHGETEDTARKPSTASAEPPSILASMPPKPPAPKSTLTPLQAAMAHKLSSARFRHLNETLYTTPSAKSLALFAKNPEMFDEYHAGFSQQVAVWPENPVDNFIKDIISRAKVGLPDTKTKTFNTKHAKGRKAGRDQANPNLIAVNTAGTKPLPRTHSGSSVLADLGCGTARLSSMLQPHLAKLKLSVHSFDLHSPSPLVTKADISVLPLRDGELDVAIFCLALMGTNWTDFVDEAWRCLHWKGEVWVGEIRSRFGRVQSKNGVVKNSIGSLDKRRQPQKHSQKKNSNKRKAAEDEDSDDAEQNVKKPNKNPEAYLNAEIDDPDMHDAQKAAAAQDTELGPFIQVMRNHGFSLDGEADLRNKMFVKMVFSKNVAPVTGKNVGDKQGEARGVRGKRFVEQDEVMTPEEEGKVLKPCVYKLR